MKKDKIGILSLGCPRNLVDSENILGRLKAKGHSVVDIAQADVAIVNTCAFIEDAKKESIDAILDLVELKKEGKLKKIIVAGCLAERYSEQLIKEIPEVDAFSGRISLNHCTKSFSITPKHYAYLKICEGCVNNCSFCVIPKIKGKFSSLEMEATLAKVKEFDRRGVKELNIIGQDICGYGLDIYGKRKLPELLKKIVKTAKNIEWIRLLYLYPGEVVEELLEIIRDEPKVCKYIDLPVQHINDRILKLMNRGTTRVSLLKLIDKIRSKIPGVAIRTSVIVGFPTETEEEFLELLKFIEDTGFERLGAFIYSREEDTPAYALKPQVPQKIKEARLEAVMLKQQEISLRINSGFMGKEIPVLIEEIDNGAYLGRTQIDAPEVDGQVYVSSPRALKPGDLVKVKITDTLEYDLVGEWIKK